ncbi:MAG TPA: hypothetical protein PKM50_05760 [Methanoregula sp.]|nr:hypothetical protein [Methanoregula sp.]
MAGTAILVLPVSATDKPVVTIVAQGAGSYYLGEEAVFSGINTDTGSTYLYITGPNLPENGGNLTSPAQKTVSGNPDTFTVVKTHADKTWEYLWYTSGLRLDAGSYTVYAVSEPKTGDQLADAPYGTTSIIVKKPFLTAGISPSSVSRGLPFTVTGTAIGIPPEVQIWIFGDHYVYNATTPVNSDASFTFNGDATLSGKLPKGQNYLIMQHPMADNQFDFVISGDYVRNQKLNNGTNLFRITGPGSLQGGDAADALITSISDQEVHDHTLTNDTYTIIPFQVTDTGSPTVVPASGASTGTAVTISADGSHSYYQGEKVILRGQGSGTVYLFMTGPNLPANGGSLASPHQAVVSGNPDSFTAVTTKPDKTWEYFWYTDNLNVGAGTYTVYAENQPKAADQLDSGAADIGMALKKPFITAQISPATISQGQPLTASGSVEGNPETVQIWILGKNYYSKSIVSVNSDASYLYIVPGVVTSKLTGGQYFAIVQHPMQNTMFDIDVSGDYVRSLQSDNATLFRISGPGNLQGNDAADALVAAFSDPNIGDDTYTIIPFQVTDTGSPTPLATAAATVPVQQTTRHVPLQYAIPIGAGALVIVGIVLWKRN